MSDRDEFSNEPGPHPIEAAPGLARIAVGAWLRGAAWGINATVRAGRRLNEAAASGESASELIAEARDETIAGLRHAIGVGEEDRIRSLRQRGAELFERAARLDAQGDAVHPGFDRIIDQLAPDEARILRLLVNDGPQAIVYVNRAAPLGIGAREVARRLSLIGREAGCLHPDHVPAYLDNLVRLGLVAIRRDPVPDEHAYQVVEAQPDVVEAMRSAGGTIFRARSARRSVHLTDFGQTFCRICFPAEHLSSELGPIELSAGAEIPPPHSDPDELAEADPR
jgi:hypothetical protein